MCSLFDLNGPVRPAGWGGGLRAQARRLSELIECWRTEVSERNGRAAATGGEIGRRHLVTPPFFARGRLRPRMTLAAAS